MVHNDAGNEHLNVGDFFLITSGADYAFSSTMTFPSYVLYRPSSSVASEVELRGSH
jgi:hypothetical protein